MGRPKKNTNVSEPVLDNSIENEENTVINTDTPSLDNDQKDKETAINDEPSEIKEDVMSQDGEGDAAKHSDDQQTDEPKSIPANVDKLLKVFRNLPELYIGDKGGIYTSEHKEFNTKKYTNPYYNK